MANTARSGEMTGKPLIESDRVEGTTVYDPRGNNIGSIKRLMIDKLSGKVAYAVMSFGGFLGIGEEEHTVPWNKLTYDTSLGGFRTDITEEHGVPQPSTATVAMTGAIVGARQNCTIIGEQRLIGASDGRHYLVSRDAEIHRPALIRPEPAKGEVFAEADRSIPRSLAVHTMTMTRPPTEAASLSESSRSPERLCGRCRRGRSCCRPRSTDSRLRPHRPGTNEPRPSQEVPRRCSR
jgi:PRC-barrel domain